LFANLISNSIDACQRGGAIRVRLSDFGGTWATEPRLRVTIADNGSGIKQADISHVFEPFYTTKKDLGTGLGLWICKQIAEKYGGTIRLRSHAKPGRSWTVVSVFLPVTISERHNSLPPVKNVA
ncbi:MAG TPA: ATP-binding protein, partial [Terriglobales bacterium]|nr:ATP-binding protein [Terriglobales bacterium]